MPSLDIVVPAHDAEKCLARTLEAIFAQTVPGELSFGVIVVNNRSSDGTGELIERWAGKGVRRIDNYDTQGRSSTINAGVAASKAEYIFVLDADCRLVGQDCLRLIALAIAEDIDAGFGFATGSPGDFWGRYHRSLKSDRVNAGWQSWTTSCCLIRREVFESIGGFSPEYRHYGFEDRDFICRLKSFDGVKSIRSLPDLLAIHDDAVTMQDVSEKMYLSGRYSSGVFRGHFPNEYLRTGYARVDVDSAPWYLVAMLKLFRPLLPIMIQCADFLTRQRNIPLAIGRPAVRLCSALSFFAGTVDRNRYV